jgi:hypothetical protein
LSVNYLTDEFSFWTRGGVQQAALFISRVVVARTAVGKIQTVTPEGGKEFDPDTVLTDFIAHVIVKPNKLALAMVTSKNYPRRVCFEVMQDVAKKWEEVHPNWASYVTGVDKQMEFPYMTKHVAFVCAGVVVLLFSFRARRFLVLLSVVSFFFLFPFSF